MTDDLRIDIVLLRCEETGDSTVNFASCLVAPSSDRLLGLVFDIIALVQVAGSVRCDYQLQWPHHSDPWRNTISGLGLMNH